MPAQTLPVRPDLEQLKRQAKALLKTWRRASPALPQESPSASESASGLASPPRLRDAQRAVAEQYGFASWDALRAHVERVTGGRADAGGAQRPRSGLDYEDPVPDVIPLHGAITPDVAARLAEQRVGGVKVDASVPSDGLVYLASVPTLERLDLSNRDDIADDDLAFLERMPWLTAVSLARCGRISDRAVAHLRDHPRLEQINLQWTRTGDDAVAALVGKPMLSRVVLGGRLTDAGVARLREFPALALTSEASPSPDSFLAVSSARSLTDVALEHLGTLKGVAALDLHMSVFGSASYTARGVAHLRGMTSLEALNFHGALASSAVLREIARIPRLRFLHCQDIASEDDGFIALGECATIEKLAGRFCPRVTDRGFAAIARLPRLTSLALGGPRVTDAAMAPLADSASLTDLGPILFGDDAFAHIAKIPHLERLTNMYNRATTDAATRHLRNHAPLVHYSAYGTQITDESLRILADLPALETVDVENCAGITDDGLRELARVPRLRKVSAWSCLRVAGTWLTAMPRGVDAKSETGPPGQADGYRAETLMDYPDLPMPANVDRAAISHNAETGAGSAAPALPNAVASSPPSDLLAALVPLGVEAVFVPDGLRISTTPGADNRWSGALTPEPFAVPLRIEVIARPIQELRLLFGSHRDVIVFDETGDPQDASPWFLKVDAQHGRSHHPATSAKDIGADEWTHIVLEVDDGERRLFVNGDLRHTWNGDFARLRSRIAIGPRHSTVTVRELIVHDLTRPRAS